MNEELVIQITAEIDGLKKEVEEAKKQIENFTKESKQSFESFNDAFQKVGDVSKTALKVVGGAVAGITTALLATVSSTEEYRNAMAKLETAFESAGSSAETAKNTYNDLYRVLGDSDVAVEASNHLAKLTQNEEDLATWTKICEGVYATFGDSLPIEGLTEASNETAKTGQLTGVLADALNWCGISEDDFQAKLDACNTEAEREALIRNTLIGLYDESANMYEENASSLLEANDAQRKLDDAMAVFGETMQPVMTALKELAGDVLTQLAPYLQEFADNYLPAIMEALSDVGTKIGEVIAWIADNWELISTIGTIILGVATAITVVSTALSVYSTIMTIVNTVSLPVIGTIALIVAGITALIAIIVVCVKHWDEIKEAISNFVKSAGEAISNFVNSVGQWFNNMKEKMSNAVQKAKEAVVNKFEEIKTNASNKVQAMKDSVHNTFTSITDGMKQKITDAKTAIVQTFENIKSGVAEKLENLKSKVSGIVNTIKGFLNFKFSFPSIPLPHFSISPSGWKVGDLLKGSIPKLGISWYAQGGVFDNPTLFGYGNGMLGGLGENGAEAVVPLEKNTEWLDKIADRLASRQSSTPVVIEVDGQVFGKTAINTINQNTKQTGKLALQW